MGDTATSVNQGGASGSTGIQFGGKQMRMAAAEARRVLVEMAAAKLGTPADQLIVIDGVVSAAFNRDKKTSYAELIGGKYFNVQLDWNKQIGNALYAPGKAQPKKHTEYKIVGKPIKREDVAPKVFAQEDFCTDIKVPGMVHGRMIRPAGRGRGAGEGRRELDQGHPRRQGGLAEGLPRRRRRQGMGRDQGRREAQGRMVEGRAAVPGPGRALRPHPQGAGAQERRSEGKTTATSTRRSRPPRSVIEAEYEWPFQSHACMGPACARGRDQGRQGHVLDRLAEVALRADRPCGAARRAARRRPRASGMPVPAPTAATTPTIARRTPPCWRRRSASRCACNTRASEGTGWDPKGPASIHKARAAIDAQGNVIAYEFMSKGFSRIDVNTNGSKLHDTLAGHTLGVALKSGEDFGVPAESYEFANKKMGWETIPPLLDRASPLRTSHLRDPVGPQIHFASESFMDEVAAATRTRIRSSSGCKHVKDPRDQAVIKAAAEKFGWDTRPSPRKDQTGNKVSGRGIAYAQRNGTSVAVIARGRGRPLDRQDLGASKFTVAHDCGQIINPDGLEKCIEGNIVQGISRTLWEEVKFDNKSVTSVDWMTYPILDITETPEKIDFALINHPELPPTGAGEPSIRPVAAAIANAIFDATGVRIRRVPFSPDRVKQALS